MEPKPPRSLEPSQPRGRPKVGAGRKRPQRRLRKLRGRRRALVNTWPQSESQMQKEAEGDSGDTVTNGIFQGCRGTGCAVRRPGMCWELGVAP